jgi:hypothetical protein
MAVASPKVLSEKLQAMADIRQAAGKPPLTGYMLKDFTFGSPPYETEILGGSFVDFVALNSRLDRPMTREDLETWVLEKHRRMKLRLIEVELLRFLTSVSAPIGSGSERCDRGEIRWVNRDFSREKTDLRSAETLVKHGFAEPVFDDKFDPLNMPEDPRTPLPRGGFRYSAETAKPKVFLRCKLLRPIPTRELGKPYSREVQWPPHEFVADDTRWVEERKRNGDITILEVLQEAPVHAD